MTQEIIEMARQAGWSVWFSDDGEKEMIEAVAKLAAAKERERIFDMLHEMHAKEKGRHNYYLHAVVTLKQKENT